MLFDSHAHYNDERFLKDVNEVLNSLKENNVGYVMNACSSIEEIPYILELAEKYDFLYASVGVHPHEVHNMKETDLNILKNYANHKKVKAIGEIGLDYYYDNSPRDVQKEWFYKQIELAKEIGLPIIIHDRDAHRDCMEILKKADASKCGGVFHCYSASAEMLDDVIDMGFFVAFGGSITFKNANKPVEAVKKAPTDRILIETDCPYLTPEPYRGKRNSSLYIGNVVKKIAQIKQMDEDEIESITYENAKKCFRID